MRYCVSRPAPFRVGHKVWWVFLCISGWWLTYPSEKYEFVNGKDDIPYMKWKIKNMFQTTNQHDLLTVFSPGFLPCAAVQTWNLRSLLSWWEQFPWAQKTKQILAFAAKLESCHPRNLCLHWYQPTWASTCLGSQASDSSSPEVPNYFQTSFQRANVFLATGPCLRQKYGESRRMYGLPPANHTSQWKITYFCPFFRVLPIKNSISSGCSIAIFDCWRVLYTCPDKSISYWLLFVQTNCRFAKNNVNSLKRIEALHDFYWFPTSLEPVHFGISMALQFGFINFEASAAPSNVGWFCLPRPKSSGSEGLGSSY